MEVNVMREADVNETVMNVFEGRSVIARQQLLVLVTELSCTRLRASLWKQHTPSLCRRHGVEPCIHSSLTRLKSLFVLGRNGDGRSSGQHLGPGVTTFALSRAPLDFLPPRMLKPVIPVPLSRQPAGGTGAIEMHSPF
jgi:hypothetical protein